MLNIYRVISLSLITALFFAAPLLCVHPISFQMKRAEHRKDKRVRVVSQKVIRNPQIKARNVSVSWARSIHSGHKTSHREDSMVIWSRDESMSEDDRTDWDVTGEGSTVDTAETVSPLDL